MNECSVTRQDVGDGWWEGINSRGEKGLFPAEYVSPINENSNNHSNNDSWITSNINDNNVTSSNLKPPLVSFSNPAPVVGSNITQQIDQYDVDWADDDWDDDDSQASEFTVGEVSHAITPHNQISPIYVSGGPGAKQQPQTVKKSINRFSHFVKSGGEDYILGLKTYNVYQNDYIHIIDENDIFKWSPSYFNVTVSVENPKKESKMKGLKSYIAYQLTPSDTGIPVSRRYKHFDWLLERLQDKFSTIPIPSLPDKQISGRYQEDFIENRRIQLQSWVTRICRHPVLSQSTVWKHFITCKDEKQWKNGKRRAEKDELVGGLFFLTIQIPDNASFSPDIEKKLEKFARFILKMDESTKNIYNISQEMNKRYQSFYKREFCKISSTFSNLNDAFMSSPMKTNANKALIEALNHTSTTYDSIGKLFDDQHWQDFTPLANLMHEYRGILAAWPEIHQVYKGAINKKKEHRKAFEENRLDEAALAGINKRADVVTYATLAEMNHFEEERIIDFHTVMRTFLTGQLNLYKNIVSKLEETLEHFPE